MNRRTFAKRILNLQIVLLAVLPLTITGCSKSAAPTGNDAGISRAKRDVAGLTACLNKFYNDHGRYPTNAEGVNALITQPAGVKDWAPYVEQLPNDPWNQPYHYAAPGKHNTKTFDVFSTGPDQKEGTTDDIGNW